jgi:hypothetical protein
VIGFQVTTVRLAVLIFVATLALRSDLSLLNPQRKDSFRDSQHATSDYATPMA